MPLQRKPDLQNQYSTNSSLSREENCDDDLDALFDAIDWSGRNVETAEEVLASLTAADLADKTILDQPQAAPANPEWSKNVSEIGLRSKNVSAGRSKNVSARQRRSPANDEKIIAKMRSFVPRDDPGASTSLVSSPLPTPSSALRPPPTPANENLIPVWSLTSEAVTAVCATVALLIAEKPAVAFTFNLTPEAIAEAMDSPTGFLDSLKRSFDLELGRLGMSLPYWFCIDIDDDGRLHIHGAFLPSKTTLSVLRKIRRAMKAAWGEWQGVGKHKQVLFKTLYSDDWATYSIRHQPEVAKIIGSSRTFTVKRPLGRDAEWVYMEIRRLMRTGIPRT